MATSKALVRALDGTPVQICFRNTTDFSPTAANDLRIGSPTLGELKLSVSGTGLANGSYRQSTKVDLGDPRAARYKVRAALEFAATPTAGNVVDLYWAPSGSGTAGTANAGGTSGADGAYTGYSSNADAAIKQLDFIGSFVCTTQTGGTVQVGEVGVFEPTERYGSIVVRNSSGAAMWTDSVEIHIVLDPLVPEMQ